MPLSSVLGASSVIKPGVCTSSTRPAVPYEGQLIYETDTDRVAAYNGSTWVYTHSSGLVYITGATFSAVASVSSAASTFTSTYANYLVLVDVSSVSTTLDVLLRFRTGSTDASTAYYWKITGATPISGSNTSSITVLDDVVTANTSFGGSCSLTVFSPQLTRNTNVVGNVFSEGNILNGVLGGGLYNTTSYDAFTLLTSTGTMTGNYRVYGYANS